MSPKEFKRLVDAVVAEIERQQSAKEEREAEIEESLLNDIHAWDAYGGGE